MLLYYVLNGIPPFQNGEIRMIPIAIFASIFGGNALIVGGIVAYEKYVTPYKPQKVIDTTFITYPSLERLDAARANNIIAS